MRCVQGGLECSWAALRAVGARLLGFVGLPGDATGSVSAAVLIGLGAVGDHIAPPAPFSGGAALGVIPVGCLSTLVVAWLLFGRCTG